MLRFRTRAQQVKLDGEWRRRFAVLAEILSRPDDRPGRNRGDEIFDITDLDELQCRQLWPETAPRVRNR
jgi:hypothetical protein